MDRRQFLTSLSALALASNAYPQSLYPDGKAFVGEGLFEKPISYKIQDLSPEKYKSFQGVLTIDYYISPKPETEFFRDNIQDITSKFQDFFSQYNIKTRMSKSRTPLSKHSSANSIGIEFHNPLDFISRINSLVKSNDIYSRYSGCYIARQRIAFLRAGKEFTDTKITANRAMHELLHSLSLIHPDSFNNSAPKDNIMSPGPIEELEFDSSSLGQSLSKEQVSQMHSFLNGENVYRAFKASDFNIASFALKIRDVNSLAINPSSLNK